MDPRLRRLGEFGLLIEHVETGRAAGLAAAIRGALPEVHEVVPGLDSVMVLDPRDDLVARVSAVLERDIPATVTTRHELKIVLDGPDLAEVLAVTGLSRAELETALEATLTVAAIGFSPGFGYLTGLAGPLADLGRRPTPRPRVPAGSLAVAAGMVAIYPHATPGGWWLLGRSSATLFDLDRPLPGLLAVGDEVRLVIVPDDAPGPIPAPRRRLVPPDGVRPVLEVTAVPAGTSLVDDGRRGVAHLGVPTAGAADLERCEVAARLVGGGPGAIEVTGSGLELCILESTVVAGVDLGLDVDGRRIPRGCRWRSGLARSCAPPRWAEEHGVTSGWPAARSCRSSSARCRPTRFAGSALASPPATSLAGVRFQRCSRCEGRSRRTLTRWCFDSYPARMTTCSSRPSPWSPPR